MEGIEINAGRGKHVDQSTSRVRGSPRRSQAALASRVTSSANPTWGDPPIFIGTRSPPRHSRCIDSWTGRIDNTARPDEADGADPRVWEVSQRALIAASNGLPVRGTVAEEMHLTKATVDRLIRKAKDTGYLDDADLPKRPQPRQKDRR